MQSTVLLLLAWQKSTIDKGKIARQHYAYEKLCLCALLICIEPRTSMRLARVFDRQTKREYALFL
jgi:hypothetical protein